jgi:phosphoglycerate dehydrogenase-like enzyme
MATEHATTGPVIAVHGGPFGAALLGAVRSAVPDATLVEAGSPDAADAEVLATLAVPDALDHLTPSVRWVHVLGAGVDGVPLAAVGDRQLTCSRGAAAPAIAEWVLAAVLAVEKDLPGSWIDEPPARWNTGGLGGLEGRTVGIVGLGSIGTEVARRALAFGSRVVGVRRHPGPSPVEGVTATTDLGEVLGAADHLVVAAPATPATAHLLDEAAFARVRPGLHLVNVARGTLVDQEALVRALDDGRVAVASLDVVDPEPLPAGHVLYRHPKVRLTPHVSWSSPRTVPRTMELFAANLDRYRAGEPLAGRVDPSEGY